MKFTDIFINRPVLATVISLLILCLGLRAISDLTLRQFPKMENTVISVTTVYPGANADLMQGFITAPLEKAIASADGIDYLTADSNEGISTIKAFIKLNYSPAQAMTDIMAKVAETRNVLPQESKEPVIQKETGSTLALMYISFSSANMTNQQITDYLTRVVQPKLQTVSGVASADILGGQSYAMRIWLDSEKMAALNINNNEITNALRSQNFQSAAGQIKGKYVQFNIRADTSLNEPNQFKNIIVKTIGNTVIRLKDIATVELGATSYDSSVTFDGKNAVFIGIQSTPTANPLTVIDDVKKILPSLASNYPSGFEGKVVYDSTEYIRNSIHEVILSITEASIIVIGVIFLFLGTIRSVAIPVVTIPLSLIGVCSLMYAMGYSINLLTLLAMVLAIGLVVDDAIVVVENIYRHIEEGHSPLQAALMGAREIAGPIIAMTTTLAAVYAPIGFMKGLTGALFKEFAFTLAFSVIISGIIALTLSPMMCSKLLNSSVSELSLVHKIDEIFEKLKRWYQEKLRQVLKLRSVVLAFIGIILAGCALLAMTTTTELAPEEDQSVLFLAASAPQSANIDFLTRYTDQLNNIFRSFPETQDFFMLNGMGTPQNAFGGLILKPWNQRKASQQKINGLLQAKIEKVAGLKIAAFPLPSIPGTGDSLPVQFVLTTTDDYTVLEQVVQKLQAAAMNSGLFLFVDSDLKFEKPRIEIDIDKEKAGLLGVSMQDVGSALAIYMGGGEINRFSREGQSYLVIPQVLQSFRFNPEKIKDIYVPIQGKNEMIPLSSIISLHTSVQPNSLNQFQQLNSVTLQGLVMPGKSLMQGLNFLRDESAKLLPLGISYDYAGQSRQAIQEGNEMLYTFFFALLIIYLVLSAQFESFRDPLIILISVPMSIMGALIPLHIGIATLNIYSGIGLVTLIGLISKHGILMVEFANKLQETEEISINDAIIKSASLRLRPILMTTAAMVLGVLPLILASGAGAKSRFDIGLVIATGMLIGTCFTLFIVPSVYTMLAKKRYPAVTEKSLGIQEVAVS